MNTGKKDSLNGHGTRDSSPCTPERARRQPETPYATPAATPTGSTHSRIPGAANHSADPSLVSSSSMDLLAEQVDVFV